MLFSIRSWRQGEPLPHAPLGQTDDMRPVLFVNLRRAMEMRPKVLFGAGLLSACAALAWVCFSWSEPTYSGRRLTEWLEDYNRAQSLETTASIAEGIRAMGTNSLPVLLAHIGDPDSLRKVKLVARLRKLSFLRLPFYGAKRLRGPSFLALRALGPNAAPAFPRLLAMAENPTTRHSAMVAFAAIGTNSIPTLASACRSTNRAVRVDAAWTIATLRAVPDPRFAWGWNPDPINGRRLILVEGRGRDDALLAETLRMLKDPNPDIRRASAEDIQSYSWSFHAAALKSATPLLDAAAKDTDQSVRKAAQETLEFIKSRAAQDPSAATKVKDVHLPMQPTPR